MKRSDLLSILQRSQLLASLACVFLATRLPAQTPTSPQRKSINNRDAINQASSPSQLIGEERATERYPGGAPQFDSAPILRAAEQLSSPRFSDRRKATRQIRDWGAQAHAVLERVATESDSESASRAIEILSDAMNSKDSTTSDSAKASLKRISDSRAPLSASAKLRLNRDDGMPQILNRLGLAPRAIIGPPKPAIPPAFAPQRRANLRISIRTKNGIREIKVVQNDRTFQFRDTGMGIETERPDGQGGVKKQTYKDEQELQKSDPEAHDAFRKAGGNGGINRARLRIQVQGGFGRPPQFPKP